MAKGNFRVWFHKFKVKLFCAVGFVYLLFMLGCAVGQPYMTLSLGKTHLGQIVERNWWYQDEFAHSEQANANSFGVGIGYRVKPWLAFELDYRNLGAYHADSMSTPSDAAYFGGCVTTNTCPATAMIHAIGTVQGFAPSMILSYPATVSPFVRFGEFFYRTTWKVHASVNQISMYNYEVPDGPGGFPGDETRKGFKPFYAFGLKYKTLRLESITYPDMSTNASGYGRKVTAWSISSEINF
jgi:OmpA family protein